MNPNFENLYRDFVTKIFSKAILDEEWINIKQTIEVIIPIFNRALVDKNLYFELKNMGDIININNINNINININIDTEGDKLVAELNECSLKKLDKYIINNIYLIEDIQASKTMNDCDDDIYYI